jgi:hypothetical protein
MRLVGQAKRVTVFSVDEVENGLKQGSGGFVQAKGRAHRLSENEAGEPTEAWLYLGIAVPVGPRPTLKKLGRYMVRENTGEVYAKEEQSNFDPLYSAH